MKIPKIRCKLEVSVLNNTSDLCLKSTTGSVMLINISTICGDIHGELKYVEDIMEGTAR